MFHKMYSGNYGIHLNLTIVMCRHMSEKERQAALAKSRIAGRKARLLKVDSRTGLTDRAAGMAINVDTDDPS